MVFRWKLLRITGIKNYIVINYNESDVNHDIRRLKGA